MSDPSNPSRGGDRLALLFLAALLIRVAALVASGSASLPAGLTAWEWGGEAPTLAESLYEGRGFGDPWGHDTGPSSWLTPPYSWTLAQLMGLGGGLTSTTAALLFVLQSALSAWTCLLIVQLGRRLGQPAAGRLGGWLFAVYPLAIWNATSVVWDTTFVCWGVTAFLVVLRARGPDPRGALVSGLCFGALLFLNPAPVGCVPAILLWFVVRRGKRGLASAATFLAAAALICLPWMLRNQRVLGTLQLRPNFGAELRMGNHDDAHGHPVPWETHPSHVESELALYRELGEAEYGRESMGRALDWISADYGRFAALTAHRVQLFWLGQLPSTDPRRSGDVDAGADPASWLKWLFFALSGAGALIALAWIGLRPADRILLIGCLVLFGIPYYVTHVSERYRFPIDAVLVLLDAWLVLRLFRPALARRPAERAEPGGMT